MKAANRGMLLGVVAAVIWHTSARAESGLVVVSGAATEHERSAVGGAVETTVQKAGWSLPPKPLAKKDSDGLLNCTDSKAPWTCLTGPYPGVRDLRDLLLVSVDMQQAENGAPIVVITGKMIAADPPSFAVVRRFCEHCADDKLGEAGQELAEQLLRQIATRSGRTIISIKSVPSPAAIIFDGARAGATDATFNTFPGAHTVVIEKAGYRSETRELTVEAGKTAEVTVALSSSSVDTPRVTPPPDKLVPGILIGAGTPLTVFGAISLYRGQVSGSDGKYDYTRATAIGVTTGIIGLGAIGTGVYLLLRGSSQSGPSASATPGGAVVGWAGSF